MNHHHHLPGNGFLIFLKLCGFQFGRLRTDIPEQESVDRACCLNDAEQCLLWIFLSLREGVGKEWRDWMRWKGKWERKCRIKF